MKKVRKAKGFSWQNLTVVLTTLTLAVGLLERVEHVGMTIAQDVIAMDSAPVTYAQLEALRMNTNWPSSKAPATPFHTQRRVLGRE